jgi:hypothetical protein
LRQRDWNNGGYDYRWDVVSPRSIVRSLQRNDYRNISRPVLSGNFYQVKAINPDGRRVKLYIDPYSRRIAKVKSWLFIRATSGSMTTLRFLRSGA